MDKLDYQVKISEILDNAFRELNYDDFQELLCSIKESLEGDKITKITSKELTRKDMEFHKMMQDSQNLCRELHNRDSRW